MWFKIIVTREIPSKKETKTVQDTYLSDTDNFAEAGYRVMQYWNGECEVESVQLLKTLKPLANERTTENDKLYIVKIAEDFVQDDGRIKTMKYPVPFFAENSETLQKYIKEFMDQGLQDMRVTTISETKWEVI